MGGALWLLPAGGTGGPLVPGRGGGGRGQQIDGSTAYRYLDEGIGVLAALATDLATAIRAAKAAGHGHLNLDGTLIRTDRVAHPGPNGADLWWSRKHKHHGGNVQVLSDPDGWPI